MQIKGYQPKPMCVIDVLSTELLANTFTFAEQSLFGLFDNFKKSLQQLSFIFFEFGDRQEADRRVLLTHESFNDMTYDRCNTGVFGKDRNFMWSANPHQAFPDQQIDPSDVLEPVKSSTFDLNEFPEEGRPPWETRR